MAALALSTTALKY